MGLLSSHSAVLFNSSQYLLFLPILWILYRLMPSKYRWLLLLVGSYFFYASWKWEYLILILISTFTDYYAAKQIEKNETNRKKNLYLYASLLVNLGLLSVFKYLGFFTEIYNDISSMFNGSSSFDAIKLILPVGISFYTFQTLSYTIDVYWGRQKAYNHLGKFALFVCFFPQLVAGPIERSSDLLPQIDKLGFASKDQFQTGLRLILWGLFKKIVLADRLALFVDPIYNNPELYQGGEVLFALACFTFQIYFDFSGYSDIAIGSARLFGVKLSTNFLTPLFRKNLQTFWNYWHITLYTWIRDYIFNPLALQLRKNPSLGIALSLIIAFTLSGLWHGAAWTFVLWGFLQGAVIALERLSAPFRDKLFVKAPILNSKIITGSYTFAIWTFSLLLFRATDFSNASAVFVSLLDTDLDSFNLYKTFFKQRMDFLLILGFVPACLFIEYRLNNYPTVFQHAGNTTRQVLYVVLVLLILFWGVPAKPFIYFQF